MRPLLSYLIRRLFDPGALELVTALSYRYVFFIVAYLGGTAGSIVCRFLRNVLHMMYGRRCRRGVGEDENKCVIQIMMTSENYSLQSSLTLLCSCRVICFKGVLYWVLLLDMNIVSPAMFFIEGKGTLYVARI